MHSPPVAPSRSARSRRWTVLAVVCASVYVINLDLTIVNSALPSLVREMGATTRQLQWIVDAYNLDVRRLRPGRREPVRPLRPAGARSWSGSACSGWPVPLGSLAGGPTGLIARPGRDGHRRRRDLPDHLVDHRQRLPRPARAGPGHRRVGRDDRHRRGHRAPGRRVAAGAVLVGQRVPGHGAGRGPRHRSLARVVPDLARPGAPAPRPRRAGAVDRHHRHRSSTRSSRRPTGLDRAATLAGFAAAAVLLAVFVAWERRARAPDARRPPVHEPALHRRQRRGHDRASSRSSASSSSSPSTSSSSRPTAPLRPGVRLAARGAQHRPSARWSASRSRCASATSGGGARAG